MRTRGMRLTALTVAVAASAVMLTGCSAGRSIEAFCNTMEEHKEAYLEQMDAAQGAGLGGLLTAVSAVGDLKTMWKELAEVAPEDIRSDVESVSETWQKQEDNAASGDWLASIATGLLNSGSMSRVDSYVRENCDGDYTVDVQAGESEESEPEPVVTPEPEPVLLTDQWADRNGYTYTFELQTATGTASKDVANATPGNANVTWNYSFAGTITNTTPERNAPAPRTLVIEPAWPGDSAICSIGGMAIDSAFSSNVDGMEERWCTLTPFPFAVRGTQTDIPMNSSMPVQASGGGMTSIVVPEGQADSIVAALSEPTIWALGRDEGEGRLYDCLLESGGFYLSQATADTGCTTH